MGGFSHDEKKKLVPALCGPEPSPDAAPQERNRWLHERSRRLQECERIKTRHAGNQDQQQSYKLVQYRVLRSDHAIARQIEKHADKIRKLTAKDAEWRARVRALVDALYKIAAQVPRRKKGAPRKLPTVGALYLAHCYCLARGRKRVPKSRKGPFAKVLRIVYGVADPMPIVREIIESPAPSVRMYRTIRAARSKKEIARANLLFEREVLAYKRRPSPGSDR